MVKTHFGLSEKDYIRSLDTIPNLNQIIVETKLKLLSFINSPIQKFDYGAYIFDCIQIQKDGSSKTNYDFLNQNQRNEFSNRYEKGFFFSQVKIFEALFDRRNNLQNEIIEHALFLVFAENNEYLRSLRTTQISKILTIMKNIFFVSKPEIHDAEMEIFYLQYQLDVASFENLKIQSIKDYMAYFTTQEFTNMYCELFGINSPDILGELLACYDKFKYHTLGLINLYQLSPNKAYWFIKNKFQPACLEDFSLLNKPYHENSDGLKYFFDSDTYNKFLKTPKVILDVITNYPKSDQSEQPLNGKKLSSEHIFSSYSIFNLQTYYIANSKFKECFVPNVLKICFSTRFFIFKKLNETRNLTVNPALATRALDLIYEELLQYSPDTLKYLIQVTNYEKPKKIDATALKFIDEIKILEQFISDNQVFNGIPSLHSNLNLVKDIHTYLDLVQIALDWQESYNTHYKLLKFSKNIEYEFIDFSKFHEHLILLNKDFYAREKCKELFPEHGTPERLTSFVFSCRISSQYVVFYIRVKHIFDQYVLDVAKTPTGCSVRSEEFLIASELVKFLNKNHINLKPKLEHLCIA